MRVFAKVRGIIRPLALIGFEVSACLVEDKGVSAGNFAPHHVASGEVGLFAQRVEPHFVREERGNFVCDGTRIPERNHDAASVAE